MGKKYLLDNCLLTSKILTVLYTTQKVVDYFVYYAKSCRLSTKNKTQYHINIIVINNIT